MTSDNEVIRLTNAAQNAAAQEHMRNTVLYALAVKCGRVPQGTLNDFMRQATQLYRDQVIACAFTVMVHMLNEELPRTAESRLIYSTMIEAAQEKMVASERTFRILFEYIHEEHKEEIQNEIFRNRKHTECPNS